MLERDAAEALENTALAQSCKSPLPLCHGDGLAVGPKRIYYGLRGPGTKVYHITIDCSLQNDLVLVTVWRRYFLDDGAIGRTSFAMFELRNPTAVKRLLARLANVKGGSLRYVEHIDMFDFWRIPGAVDR
jgi:hypothetical protein